MTAPSWLKHLEARARGEVAGYFDPNTPMEARGAQPTPLAPTPTGELAHPDTIADSQAAGVDVVVQAPAREDTTPPAVPTTLAPDPRHDDLMAQVEQLLAEVREQRGAEPAPPAASSPWPDPGADVEPGPAPPAASSPWPDPGADVEPGPAPPVAP